MKKYTSDSTIINDIEIGALTASCSVGPAPVNFEKFEKVPNRGDRVNKKKYLAFLTSDFNIPVTIIRYSKSSQTCDVYTQANDVATQ